MARHHNQLSSFSPFSGMASPYGAVIRDLKNRLGVDVFADPPAEIELPMSLLEVLHPKNFLPVPAVIKADASVFHQSDMKAALHRQLSKMGRKARGVGLVWVDPYSDVEDEAA